MWWSLKIPDEVRAMNISHSCWGIPLTRLPIQQYKKAVSESPPRKRLCRALCTLTLAASTLLSFLQFLWVFHFDSRRVQQTLKLTWPSPCAFSFAHTQHTVVCWTWSWALGKVTLLWSIQGMVKFHFVHRFLTRIGENFHFVLVGYSG